MSKVEKLLDAMTIFYGFVFGCISLYIGIQGGGNCCSQEEIVRFCFHSMGIAQLIFSILYVAVGITFMKEFYYLTAVTHLIVALIGFPILSDEYSMCFESCDSMLIAYYNVLYNFAMYIIIMIEGCITKNVISSGHNNDYY